MLHRHFSIVHTCVLNVNPYKCEICLKTFTKSGSLKEHSRLHSGDKPYKCDVCWQSFTRSQHLKVHFRIHSGEKPYTCEICSATFTTQTEVKVHSRKHSGENHTSVQYVQLNSTGRIFEKTL